MENFSDLLSAIGSMVGIAGGSVALAKTVLDSRKPKQEKIKSIAAKSDKKYLEMSIRAESKAGNAYIFDAFANVYFSLTAGKPTNVFAVYSTTDRVVTKNDPSESGNWGCIELTRNEKNKNGQDYSFRFPKDYRYASHNREKNKIFLVFVQTVHELNVAFLIMQQRPQFIQQEVSGGMHVSPLVPIDIRANECNIYLDTPDDMENVMYKYKKDSEIMSTIHEAQNVLRDRQVRNL